MLVTAETPAEPPPPKGHEPCAYVVRSWRFGGLSPFCDAPTVARTPYCARHLALCRVGPATAEGRRLAAGQARLAEQASAPPQEFARLDAVALPETLGEEPEPVDGVDLPRPRAGGAVGEEG
jgi:hypothetical protein